MSPCMHAYSMVMLAFRLGHVPLQYAMRHVLFMGYEICEIN